MSTHPLHALSAGILLAAVTLPALAQPNAGALLNQQEQKERQLPQQLPAPEAPSEITPLQKGGEVVLVKRIVFSGATDLVPEAELQQVVAYAIGTTLDFAGLKELERKVTDTLRARGWFLARAYLPQQDVTDGNIEITIRAGLLDGAEGNGSPFSIEQSGDQPLRIRGGRLEAIAAPLLPPGQAVKQADLERALLLMGDLPGISARARLQPGQTPGTSHVAIDTTEGRLLAASASVDNFGNRSTGSSEANFSLQLNDPFRIGDQVTANLVHSVGLDHLQLGYSLPIANRGLRLGINAGSLEYDVVKGLGEDAGFAGRSTTYGAVASYPIVRSRRLNLSISGGYDRKLLKDVSSAGTLDDKRVDLWNAALTGNRLDTLGGGGLTSWSATWKAGELDLSHNAADAAQDAASYQTQGHFNTLEYSLSRLQKLPGAFTLNASLNGQFADSNLDSSAQFILGGPYGVRAYPVGEASGDAGWLAHLDLRYDVPDTTPLGRLQLNGFYDIGEVTLHHDPKGIAIPTATGKNSYGLSGWGLGASLQQGNRYAVRMMWAQAIGNNPGRSTTGKDADNQSRDSRFWLQGTLYF